MLEILKYRGPSSVSPSRYISAKIQRVVFRGEREMILYHPFTGRHIAEYLPRVERLCGDLGLTADELGADLLQQSLENPERWCEVYAYGAFDGGNLIGSATLFISEGTLLQKPQLPLTGEIDGVFVAPQYRRERVASRLVNRLLFIGAAKKDMNHCELCAVTRASQKLYRSLGFVWKRKSLYRFEFPR